MRSEFLNLLPRERIQAFRRSYFVRLAVVTVFAATVLIVIHGLLLAPSFVYEGLLIVKQREHLAQLSARLVTNEDKSIGTRLDTLSANSEYLTRLASVHPASSAISSILSVPHGGIALTGMALSVIPGATTTEMQVSGLATTRAALQQYVSAFSSMRGVNSATVPISAYAQETNINFTLSLSGAFLP